MIRFRLIGCRPIDLELVDFVSLGFGPNDLVPINFGMNGLEPSVFRTRSPVLIDFRPTGFVLSDLVLIGFRTMPDGGAGPGCNVGASTMALRPGWRVFTFFNSHGLPAPAGELRLGRVRC